VRREIRVDLIAVVAFAAMFADRPTDVALADPISIGISIIVGVGLSLLGSLLLRKKVKGLPAKDENPDTTVTRGGYIPLVIGKARVAPIIMYSSQPQNVGGPAPESGPSGKRQNAGGSAPPPDMFEYEVVHCICIGPVAALDKMWLNGRPSVDLLPGINPTSVPSGSVVSFTSKEQEYGVMEPYWGARDEPIDLDNLTLVPGLGGSSIEVLEIVYLEIEETVPGSGFGFLVLTLNKPPPGVVNGVPFLVEIRGTQTEPSLNGKQSVVWFGQVNPPKVVVEDYHYFTSIVSRTGVMHMQPDPTQLDMGLTQVFSTLWDNMKTGNQKQHPLIEYGVSVLPRSQLKRSPPWIHPTWTEVQGIEQDLPHTIEEVLASSPRTRTIRIAAAKTPETLIQGSVVHISGGLARAMFGIDEAYTMVLTGAYTTAPMTSDPKLIITIGYYLGRVQRVTPPVFFQDGVDMDVPIKGAFARPEAGNLGNLYKLTSDGGGGANGAHVIDQLAFAPKPWGAGLDRRRWDIASLENLGIEFYRLRFACSIKAQGEAPRAMLAQVMQDLGVTVSFDPRTGLWGFEKLIDTTGSLPAKVEVPEEILSRPLPEITPNIGPKRADRLQFTFDDQDRNYRENTFTLGSDGQAQAESVDRVKVVEIKTTVHGETARKMAVRRQNEEFSALSAFTAMVGRGGRRLRQGIKAMIGGVPWPVLLTSIKRDPLNDTVEIKGLRDPNDDPAIPIAAARQLASFDAALDQRGFASDAAGGVDGPAAADDAIVMIMEAPRYLVDDGVMRVLVLRVRATSDEISADVWFSPDDVEFVRVRTNAGSVPGGTLVSSLAANTTRRLSSIIISPTGPDIDDVITVATDAAHRRGRLLMLIDGKEVCFVKSVTAVGDGTYSVNDVIRGRWGMDPVAHSSSAPVVFVTDRQIDPISDEVLFPGETLYCKTTPRASGYSLDLSEVTSVSLALQGLAVGPLDPANLRATDLTDGWDTGSALPLKWSYRALERSPNNGMGDQGYGDPVGATAGLQAEGEFVVRFWDGDPDGGGTVKREVDSIEQPNYSYANATMVADFSGEPTDLWVTLECVKGGLRSATVKRQFFKR